MSNFNSGPNAQGQAVGQYMNAPGYDFGPRYGMGAMGAMAMPYAFMPAMAGVPPVAPYAHGGHGNAPSNGYGDNDAVGLADALHNSLVINPQQQMGMGGHVRGQYNQGHYGGPQQRGGASGYGYGYAPPAPGMRGGQQGMMQPHMGPPGNMGGPPQHMMNGNGPYGGPSGHQGNIGPGGPRDGGRGRGRGPPGMQPQDHRQQQPQQQRRKKVQRGLEENVKRTVYISYIDQQVTEESLATFFADCGTVMDCRICGDPNSAMRFAFIEFLEEAGAQEALSKTGQNLGTSQLRVLPSKTAIVPVNKELMPRSHEELERCSRTVYVANIDKKVEREDVRNFFEHLCGKVGKIRLLGDLAHSTRIAFIEFIQAESAMAALNCSGALLGSLPLRVSPSKTPVRGDREDKEARGGRGQRPKSGNAAAQKDQAAAAAAAAANDATGEQQQEQQEANGAAAEWADHEHQEPSQQETDGAEVAVAAVDVEDGNQSEEAQDAAAAAAAEAAEAETPANQGEAAATAEQDAGAEASDNAEEAITAVEVAA